MNPRFWPTLLTALMLPILIGLGTWQVQRLHWKEDLLAKIEQRAHQAPVEVSTVIDSKDADYRPATAAGEFINNKNLFLLSISLTGQGGYHVLTPMRLQDGRMLLVDRGWIPYDRRGGKFAQPDGVVAVSGILRQPQSSGLFASRNDADKNNWYAYDLAAMAHAAQLNALLPYVLEADATPNRGGYPLGGQTRFDLPNHHLQYALTWHGFALILLIIYLIGLRTKKF